ncbi:oligosaccharide flippase family protein [Porticoccaceae bacterium]|nr:oligosaccharide flippase family protein [Porticoccaceae bacterium]
MSIKRNSAINIIGYIIPMMVMVFTIPLYLDVIGVDRYGVLALVWLIIGYSMFMEIGLGKATATEIAKIDVSAYKVKSKIFWTAVFVNLFLGFITSIIVIFIGKYLIVDVFTMSDSIREEALASMPWIVMAVPLALVGSVLNSSLEAVNKFALLNRIQVGGSVMFHVIPLLVAINYSAKLDDVIAASIMVRLVVNVTLLCSCYIYVTGQTISSFSKRRASKLLSYGKWIGLTTLVTPVLETFDRLIIGITVGSEGVSFYTVAYQLTAKIRIIPSAISRALLPPLSAASASEAHKITTDSFVSLAGQLTPLVILVGICLKPFIFLWIGPEIGKNVLPISYLFLIGMWANSVCHVPVIYLIATGRASAVGKVHLGEVFPFIVLVYYCSIYWGVTGAVFAWVFRVFTDLVIMSVIARLHLSLIKICLSAFLSIVSLMALYLWDFNYINPPGLILLVGSCLILSGYHIRSEVVTLYSKLSTWVLAK